jgi:hypothetical protein
MGMIRGRNITQAAKDSEAKPVFLSHSAGGGMPSFNR